MDLLVDELPDRYPFGAYGDTPRSDWRCWEHYTKCLRGQVFLDSGSIVNARNARARLIKAGLMEGDDEQDD